MISKKILALLCISACFIASSSASQNDGVIEGTILTPAGITLPPDSSILLRSLDDDTRKSTRPNTDGTFHFYQLKDGTYYIDVEALGLIFPTFKVILDGVDIKASIPEVSSSPDIPYPLRIAPIAPVAYFEQRQGFNILGFLKTPYGIMIGFTIFSLVIMPLIRVDPEEYKQLMEERKKRNEGSSSITSSRKER